MASRGLCRDPRQEATLTSAEPVPVLPPGLYGSDRIVSGARFLGDIDPGWWREGAMLPASLVALDMADPRRCLLAWWAARRLPAPTPGGTRLVSPYDRAVRALSLSARQAQALGFTGVDADLLSPGWRHLITDLRAASDPVSQPMRRSGLTTAFAPMATCAWTAHEQGDSWKSARRYSWTVRPTWMRAAWRGAGFPPKSGILT